MWFDPIGIFPWKQVVRFIAGSLCIVTLVVGVVFIFLQSDYQSDQRDKTVVLCQDKVAKMKLVPSEARIAYDLCKETDGRLP
jgi:glucose uptake protein GlcU